MLYVYEASSRLVNKMWKIQLKRLYAYTCTSFSWISPCSLKYSSTWVSGAGTILDSTVNTIRIFWLTGTHCILKNLKNRRLCNKKAIGLLYISRRISNKIWSGRNRTPAQGGLKISNIWNKFRLAPLDLSSNWNFNIFK